MIKLSQKSFLVGTSALVLALAITPAHVNADDFTVSAPSTTTNDGNVIDGDDSLTVTNTGSINVAGGVGVNTTGDNNTISTAGTITTSGNGFDAVKVINNNTVTNSGTIITTGDNADGFEGNTLNKFINSGLVKATGTGSNAINFISEGNELVINPGSVIIGSLNFQTATNTLTVGNGISIDKTFIGFKPWKINTNGAPYIVDGKRVVVVDPTGIVTADEVVSDLLKNVSETLPTLSSDNPLGVLADLSVTPEEPDASEYKPVADPYFGAKWWLKGFGGYSLLAESSPTVGAENYFGGIVIGADNHINADLQLGLFGGMSIGQLQVDYNSHRIDTRGYFGGAYGRYGDHFSFGITGGVLDNEGHRQIANNLVANGLETAISNYNGYFITPELTLETKMDFAGVVVKPSARLRYSFMYFDGYTETGSSANLTLAGHSAHIFDARLQLAVPLAETIEFRLGIDGRISVGNSGIDATLLGQSLSFDAGGGASSGSVFVGADFARKLSDSATIFASTEIAVGTAVRFKADAQAGIKVSF